ncbi:MAG: ABC transporter permease, partial [Chloroflexi bacterium]|nr:ABC transporter permease [Chloroflexota bacterium]
LLGIITLIGLSIVVFVLTRASGDPVALLLGPQATAEQIEAERARLGLDESMPVQYWSFIKEAATGDFGESLFYHEPASEIVMDKFPATLKLIVVSLAFGIPLGILIGVLCAIKRNKAFDILGRTLALVGQALPVFWVGILLVLIFSVKWEIFPAGGMSGPQSYVLPAATLGSFVVAAFTRLTRSAMLDVLGNDFISFARARGISEKSVILKHALKNAFLPILTFVGLIFVRLLAGTIAVEAIFVWPGIGLLSYQSVLAGDYPVVQTIVLLFGVVTIGVNLMIDLLYGQLDPRIRYT